MAELVLNVHDTTGAVLNVLDGVAITHRVLRGPVEVTASPGGGSGLPAGTAGQMFRIGTDGETVEAVSPNAPGAWVRLNEDGLIADILLRSNIVRESELAAAIAAGAARLVELHLPLAIEFVGGSFIDANTALLAPEGQPLPEVGMPVLWTEQGTGSRNDVWIHQGEGTYTRSSPSALRVARVGTLIVARQNVMDGFAPQVLRVDAANSVEELAVTAEQVEALIEAAVDPLVSGLSAAEDDISALDTRVGALESFDLGVAGKARQAIVRAEPTVAFRHDGSDTGDWRTDHVGSFTGGFDYRACIRPLYPDEPAGEWYSECGTQTRDSGVGTIDNHETAILCGHTPTNPGTVTGKPYLFFECTPTGEASEVATRLISDLHSTWGDWVTVRVTVDFSTGTVRHWLQVGWEFDDGETFDTTADGRTWWLIGQLVDAAYGSIDPAITEDWQIGHNFYGDTAWHEYYSGIGGTRMASPSAATLEPGDTTVTDTEGNVWTAQASAKVALLSLHAMPSLLPIYGTGADGDATISGTTTLTQDAYYDDLVVNGTLNLANYRLHVAGTLSGNGTIACSGTAGSGGSGGAAPGNGVFAQAGNGAGGGTGVGAQASAVTNKLGGSGGAGGAGTPNAGGAAQTGTTLAALGGGPGLAADPLTVRTGQAIGSMTGRLAGGTGGSAGGGDGAAGAGSGGGGGGIAYVAARRCTFTGSIEAKGGSGGARGAGNVGGGGGGGGGVVVVVTGSPSQSFTTDVTGGAGGAGFGTGSAGSAGSAGTANVFTGVA